jgi:hypothetical protein
MMIGSEKLLLTLGVPAAHQGHPLNCGDVSILEMAVAGKHYSDSGGFWGFSALQNDFLPA